MEKIKQVNFTAKYSLVLLPMYLNRIPEITEDLYKIDRALCAGFGWRLVPSKCGML